VEDPAGLVSRGCSTRDFTILTFLLVDIQRSFTVDKALAGALGTVTLICNISAVLGSGCWRSGFSFSTLLKP
jgi:hypothetical protein